MAIEYPQKAKYDLQDLVEIVRLLRSKDGCPWDREQTHRSIRKNFIEETYEACEAIDEDDPVLLKEELGDVLLQVALHAQIEAEAGRFCFDDVCDGICKKLISRHPHVFAQTGVQDSQKALQSWEAVKRQEKGQTTYTKTLEGVSKALPALMRSAKIQQRAARAGFEYPNIDGAMKRLHSELAELDEALTEGDREHCAEELGDLLFAAVKVARFLELDGEEVLSRACEKFINRFGRLEHLAEKRNLNLTQATVQQLEALWQEAKQ